MRLSTIPIAVPRVFTVASVVSFLLVAATGSGPATAQSRSLAGVYDGGQMEMAAALELKPDGRFDYALSYGALDEQAAGRWTVSGDRVLLSSNPVVAPRLFMVSRGRGPAGLLQLSLDVPRGMSRQYFNAMITRGDGQTQKVQLSEEGLSLPFARVDPPTAVRLVLQIFRVESELVKLDPSSGYDIQFRFEPNDIGKVDFRAEPLRIVNGDLVLDGHGRTLRFSGRDSKAALPPPDRFQAVELRTALHHGSWKPPQRIPLTITEKTGQRGPRRRWRLGRGKRPLN